MTLSLLPNYLLASNLPAYSCLLALQRSNETKGANYATAQWCAALHYMYVCILLYFGLYIAKYKMTSCRSVARSVDMDMCIDIFGTCL